MRSPAVHRNQALSSTVGSVWGHLPPRPWRPPRVSRVQGWTACSAPQVRERRRRVDQPLPDLHLPLPSPCGHVPPERLLRRQKHIARRAPRVDAQAPGWIRVMVRRGRGGDNFASEFERRPVDEPAEGEICGQLCIHAASLRPAVSWGVTGRQLPALPCARSVAPTYTDAMRAAAQRAPTCAPNTRLAFARPQWSALPSCRQ